MTEQRWFYVEAHTPHGVVFCGKVEATEREIRHAFQGCTIADNGVVSVWRGPNDTRETLRHVNAAASNATVANLSRSKNYS